MNDDNLRQVKRWVLEHALKYNMESVVKSIIKNWSFTDTTENSEFNGVCSPFFMFLILLKNIVRSFKVCKKDPKRLLSWNKRHLSLAIQLFPVTYEQRNYVPFEVYLDLITRLKLIELLRQIHEGEPSSLIVQNLNTYFPRWTPTSEEDLKKKFYADVADLKKKVQASETFCRRLILRTIITDINRSRYISESFTKDLMQFISESLVCLNTVVFALKTLEPSHIDKILSGKYDSNIESEDATIAVEVIMEFLKPDAKAEDLENLLRTLESGINSKQRLSLHSVSDDLGFTQAQNIMDEISSSDTSKLDDIDMSQDTQNVGLPSLFIGCTGKFGVPDKPKESTSDSDAEAD